jgi:hypothetical protein
MTPEIYFATPHTTAQKQYEALRRYFVDGLPAKKVAQEFGYTYRGFTTIVSEFRKQLKTLDDQDPFFYEKPKGRKPSEQIDNMKETIISMRKKHFSIGDIKVVLDSKGEAISEKAIYNILKEEGFSRLPRRSLSQKQALEQPKIQAAKSKMIDFEDEEFKSAAAGVLALLPYIERYGIHKAIVHAGYPETQTIGGLNAILCFIALKATDVARYSADDLWCMDRGIGLFAGMNVLPKAAWYTSYSHRVTAKMNRRFLTALHHIWKDKGMMSDTANLDFTTIPYWGQGDHLENNWSGKRGKALSSILAVLAHDPDSGIIDYGHAGVRHSNESDVVLEFLDFYKSPDQGTSPLRYLVFDSKFTNYEKLNELNKEGVKFLTIRRRGKKMVERLNSLPSKAWKTIRVETSTPKKRTLKALDERTYLPGYEGEIRQVCITGHGKIKPAIIIGNDFDLPLEKVVRKYARRWLVEKTISEQIEFFHLNRVSSSMVIKVDFDLVMSIVTHNIYRLFAKDLEGYSHMSDPSIYRKFIRNAAEIKILEDTILIQLYKKRNLPKVIEVLKQFNEIKYPWLGNKMIRFVGASNS